MTTVEYPADQYRFILRRPSPKLWDDYKRTDRKLRLGVVCLNPSTADDDKNDPTTDSIWRIAHRNGFEAYCLVNLSPFRATEPMELVRSYTQDGIDIFARERNDAAIAEMLSECHRVVCAWGANVNRLIDLEQRASEVRAMIEAARPSGPYCMHVTKEGHPRHPLYLPRTTLIFPWRRT